MKTLAWIYLVLWGGGMFLHPLSFGVPRMPARYGWWTLIGLIVNGIFIIPLSGRVLGWW